ncbi:putative gustatory receptor 92a [Drosophila bipectinata]|uniref:putative gustatory receptor 92a n=1 Tax=Drosophila bipectinata TaxID=42026 RepID=UPI001C89548E|nr:uncharacterized protein LOC108121773 [Drosophila bipectinata]
MDWFSYVYVVTVNHIMMRIHFFWYLSIFFYVSVYSYDMIQFLDFHDIWRAIRVLVLHKMSASKVASVIILGWSYYSRFIGLLFYRVNKFYIFITPIDDVLDSILHWTQLILTTLCYLGLTFLDLFHGPKVIKLVNRFVKLHRRVEGLGLQNRTGAEVFIIQLNLYEFKVCIFGLFNISQELFLQTFSAMVTYILSCLQLALRNRKL